MVSGGPRRIARAFFPVRRQGAHFPAALPLPAEGIRNGRGPGLLRPEIQNDAELLPGLAVLRRKAADWRVMPGPDGGQDGRLPEEAVRGPIGEAPDAGFLRPLQEILKGSAQHPGGRS